MPEAEQQTDFFSMLKLAARHSVEQEEAIHFLLESPSAWSSEIQISAKSTAWVISAADYSRSVRCLPETVSALIQNAMKTSDGQKKLLDAAIAAARQEKQIEELRPTVWQLLVADDPFE